MTIVFDMDNTLTDDFGSAVRPGIVPLLQRCIKDGHKLVLWTNSTRERAKDILSRHNLNKYFSTFLFRENYDPQGKGLPKDIRKIKGDILVDDDPAEISFVKSIHKKAFKISSYRKGTKPNPKELSELYSYINKSKGLIGKLFPQSIRNDA